MRYFYSIYIKRHDGIFVQSIVMPVCLFKHHLFAKGQQYAVQTSFICQRAALVGYRNQKKIPRSDVLDCREYPLLYLLTTAIYAKSCHDRKARDKRVCLLLLIQKFGTSSLSRYILPICPMRQSLSR